MKFGQKWSDALLELAQDLNNFDFTVACKEQGYTLFFINGFQVGIVSSEVKEETKKHADVFSVIQVNTEHERCVMRDELSTSDERSDGFNKVLSDWRQKDKFITLRGWRDETFAVNFRRGQPPLCHVERSGCPLFGFVQYGVHINGYTYINGELKMWIGRRSKTKPTFPNMLDNMCAGGLASGLGIRECAVKESQEEAAVNDDILNNLKPAGALSYCYKDERGIFPETEYIFDLELPPDFVPRNADGEMDKFYLFNIEELQDKIMAREFKPNCALVVVNFFIRHGYITADNEPNYLYLLQKMHRPLQPEFENH